MAGYPSGVFESLFPKHVVDDTFYDLVFDGSPLVEDSFIPIINWEPEANLYPYTVENKISGYPIPEKLKERPGVVQ